jgi:hypothetical protein
LLFSIEFKLRLKKLKGRCFESCGSQAGEGSGLIASGVLKRKVRCDRRMIWAAGYYCKLDCWEVAMH